MKTKGLNLFLYGKERRKIHYILKYFAKDRVHALACVATCILAISQTDDDKNFFFCTNYTESENQFLDFWEIR